MAKQIYLDGARREAKTAHELAAELRDKLDIPQPTDVDALEDVDQEIFFLLDALQSRVSKTRNYYLTHARQNRIVV